MRLEKFQKDFIRSVYDNKHGTRSAILSIARKNGKTGLIAALVLAHIVGPEARRNSQIVSGAMSRDQASLVFALASKMVQLSERLAKLVKIVPSSKRLVGLPLNAEYMALSADAKTQHGKSPALAILDEVGQVRGPTSDFIDAITTSQGAHEDPLLITISTQAANDADLLSLWIDDARNSRDPHTVCVVHEAPKDCALDDRRAWKAANPAIDKFRSRKDVEQQAEKALRMPSFEARFRNLTLNMRVEMRSPFVSRSVWEKCGDEIAEHGGRPVFCGLDLSSVSDLTSFVAVWQTDDERWMVDPYFWTPEIGVADRSHRDRVPYDVWVKQGHLLTTPGASMDYEFIARFVLEYLSEADLQVVAFDRWRMDQFKGALRRQGASDEFIERLAPFGQGFISMAPALDALEALAVNGQLAHGMHPVLTMCAANAVVVRDAAGNRKLDKAKSTGRIDGMVALTMAIGVAASHTHDEGTSWWDTEEVAA